MIIQKKNIQHIFRNRYRRNNSGISGSQTEVTGTDSAAELMISIMETTLRQQIRQIKANTKRLAELEVMEIKMKNWQRELNDILAPKHGRYSGRRTYDDPEVARKAYFAEQKFIEEIFNRKKGIPVATAQRRIEPFIYYIFDPELINITVGLSNSEGYLNPTWEIEFTYHEGQTVLIPSGQVDLTKCEIGQTYTITLYGESYYILELITI